MAAVHWVSVHWLCTLPGILIIVSAKTAINHSLLIALYLIDGRFSFLVSASDESYLLSLARKIHSFSGFWFIFSIRILTVKQKNFEFELI